MLAMPGSIEETWGQLAKVLLLPSSSYFHLSSIKGIFLLELTNLAKDLDPKQL